LKISALKADLQQQISSKRCKKLVGKDQKRTEVHKTTEICKAIKEVPTDKDPKGPKSPQDGCNFVLKVFFK
jgi:hypothetical protein